MNSVFITYKKWKKLNEIISFERDRNPLQSLGIGKTHLIFNWLNEMGVTVKNYIINDDFTINYKNSFPNRGIDLAGHNLKQLPDFIQFNECIGFFDIGQNDLITLKGCPRFVTGNFLCDNNKLTSLKYCPKIVEGYFTCYNNVIKFKEKDIKKYCTVSGQIHTTNI